jgi:hypothetical protein
VAWFEKFRLGNGALKPRLKAELESEGLVLVEEGLHGSVRYSRFRAPGRRFHGKVTGERIGIGISERRAVAYCRSGSVKLIDTEFESPRWEIVEITLEDGESVQFRIDYDRSEEAEAARVAGEIRIRARTARAVEIVDQLNARLGRT